MESSGQCYKLFTAVITPPVAYFSIILTELCRQQCNYGRKEFYNIGHSKLQPSLQILDWVKMRDIGKLTSLIHWGIITGVKSFKVLALE